MFSSIGRPRQYRPTVWLTVCAVLALAAALFGTGRLGFPLGPGRARTITATWSEGLAPHAVPARSADRDVRTDDPGVASVAGTIRGSLADAETAAGPGHRAGDHVGLGAEVRHSDPDEALFAALERLEQRVAAAMERARESVVTLEYTAADAPPGTRRVATGVVINNRGEVLSVRIDPPFVGHSPAAGRNLAPIVARDFSGHRYAACWLAADPETGLTLLRLSSRAVRPIRTAAGGPKLGSQVFVVGNPFGMGHSVSRGHVAGLNRALELGTRELGGLIQVQASLYPGDSGAAVVDLRGDWLGLIRSGLAVRRSGSGSEFSPNATVPESSSSAGLSSSTPAEAAVVRREPDTDFGFAIPAHDGLWVANQLRARGRVDRAYLGVRLEPVSNTGSITPSGSEPGAEPKAIDPRSDARPAASTSIAIEPDGAAASAQEGAILREVLAGTPAAEAGLQPGDGIVALDGEPIRSGLDLTDRLDRIPARTTVLLGVVRGRGPRRQRMSLSLLTASRPDPPGLARPISTASMPAPTSPRSTSPEAAAVSLTATADTVISPSAPVSSVSRPNELRLTLPRAVVDRLEQLERRLEKLESSSARDPGPASARKRQVSSTRNP